MTIRYAMESETEYVDYTKRSFCMKFLRYSLMLFFLFSGVALSDQNFIDVLNERCQELDVELTLAESEESNEPKVQLTYRGITSIFPSQLLEKLSLDFLNNDPYHEKTASIRTFTRDLICQEEKNVMVKRELFCKNRLENLLGKILYKKKMPRIALCLSGGGVRALVSSAGFMKGLNDNGLLDIILYISALSGSTWTLAPWMHSGKLFSDFYPHILERVVNGVMHKSPKDLVNELKNSLPALTEYFIKKLIYKEKPSLIDFYGYCLALNYSNKKLLEHYASTNITGQQKTIANGSFPIPLYSAILPKKNNEGYVWMTYSPYEVYSHDLQSAVPAWAYGRRFENGSSINNAPPLSLGFLMGLWGSACSISFKEAYNMMLDSLEPKALFAPLKYIADETVIGNTRIFPAHIANYTYGKKDLPLVSEKETVSIDAGIACNIPLLPLLNADRAVDIIIVVDASGDILGAPELKIAEEYAKKNKLPFPTIDYSSINKQSYSIFDDGPNSPAPIVIYVPMIKNNNYSQKFDPQDHLGIMGFMNTFNFEYSQEEAELLAGLFTQTAYELRKDLLKTIIKVLDRKN